MNQASQSPNDRMPASPDALRALLDSFLRCPVEATLTELVQALRKHQTDWIRAHSGNGAPPPKDAPKPAAPRPKFPIAAADLEVLRKIADGWAATTAEVQRWAWFESRELVQLEPNPAGSGPELLRLTPAGWAAAGRAASE